MSNKFDPILGEYREEDSSDLSGYLTSATAATTYLKLDQGTPQTFTNLGGGTGLMKVTAGVFGLDTSTYLTSLSGAWLLDQTTPQTVTGTPTFPTLTISSGANNSWQKFVRTSTGTGATDGMGIGYDSVGATIWQYENAPFRIGTNGTQRLSISGAGVLSADLPGGNTITASDWGYGSNSAPALLVKDDYSYTPGNSSYYRTGLQATSSVNTSNQLGGGYAFKATIDNAGTGARTAFYGIETSMSLNGSSTISNIYQAKLGGKSGNQAVTNAYGLYIDTQDVGASVTSGYSIYAVGTNDMAYFAHPLQATTLTASSGSVNGSSFLALRAGNYNLIYGEPNTTTGVNIGWRLKVGRADGDAPNAQVDAVATGGICTGTATPCAGLDETACNAQSGCTYSTEIDCSTKDYADCVATSGCSWGGNDCHAFDSDESSCNSYPGECTWDGGGAYTGCSGDYTDWCSQWSSYSISDCQSYSSSYCTMDSDYGTCYPISDCSVMPDESTCTTLTGYCSGNYSASSCSGTYGAACSGTGSGCEGSATPCSSLSSSSETCEAQDGCSYAGFPAVKASNGYQFGGAIADSEAPLSFIYIGSDHSNVPCWKDSSGTVYTLDKTAV